MFTMHGTVIRTADHGDHATVVIAPTLDDARNADWVWTGDGAAGDMLVLKVAAAAAAGIAEGAPVVVELGAPPEPKRAGKVG